LAGRKSTGIEAGGNIAEESGMLIGIDWGGTKIEGVAMTPDGAELVRLREDTPRHDYHGCIAVIEDLIA
jgi:fructokinase